jgi:hypothetical protein
MVWDPITQTLIQTLENVQRKAARFVINDYTSRTQGNMLVTHPCVLLV